MQFSCPQVPPPCYNKAPFSTKNVSRILPPAFAPGHSTSTPRLEPGASRPHAGDNPRAQPTFRSPKGTSLGNPAQSISSPATKYAPQALGHQALPDGFASSSIEKNEAAPPTGEKNHARTPLEMVPSRTTAHAQLPKPR